MLGTAEIHRVFTKHLSTQYLSDQIKLPPRKSYLVGQSHVEAGQIGET